MSGLVLRPPLHRTRATVPAACRYTGLPRIYRALLLTNAQTRRRRYRVRMARTLPMVCASSSSPAPSVAPVQPRACDFPALPTRPACPPLACTCSHGCVRDLPCRRVLRVEDERWPGLRSWVLLCGRRDSVHAMRQRVLPRQRWQ